MSEAKDDLFKFVCVIVALGAIAWSCADSYRDIPVGQNKHVFETWMSGMFFRLFACIIIIPILGGICALIIYAGKLGFKLLQHFYNITPKD